PAAQPNPSPSPESTGARSSRTLVIAGGAVLAVLVAAGAVFGLTRGGGSPDADAAAATEPTVAAASAEGGVPPATSDSAYQSETTDDVMALLPTKLITGSSSCDKAGFTTEGALEVRCLINRNSSLGKTLGMEQSDYEAVRAFR